MSTATEIPKRRTARIYLDPRLIACLLDLPEGMQVVAAEATNDPVGLFVVVASDELPEVAHDVESPRAQLTVEIVPLDDRRKFLRVTKVEVAR